MGICASFQAHRADQRMAKTLAFVKCAYAGDSASLQRMFRIDKIHPNAQDRFGMTALHWAAYGGKLLCVQELLLAGASAAIVDGNGRNALHHACRKDHEDVVRFLIVDVKMDPNARSESKDTPLHKAVFGKSIKSVEVLLQLGADPTLRNDQNRTPLEELEADVGNTRDTLPEPIPTARMDEELANWRRDFRTEVPTKAKRNSLEGLMPSNFALFSHHGDTGTKYASTSSLRQVENTLVTSFRARVSEFSDRSSLGEAASRPSSAQGGAWATPSRNSSGSSSVQVPSSGRRGSGTTAIVPLNLEGLQRSESTASTPAQSTSNRIPSIRTLAESGRQNTSAQLGRKSLKYAGKRVIMLMRVKTKLPGDEKREMIRLLLEKRLKVVSGGDNTAEDPKDPDVATSTPSTSSAPSLQLRRVSSGITLSLPSNI